MKLKVNKDIRDSGFFMVSRNINGEFSVFHNGRDLQGLTIHDFLKLEEITELYRIAGKILDQIK